MRETELLKVSIRKFEMKNLHVVEFYSGIGGLHLGLKGEKINFLQVLYKNKNLFC